MTEVIGQWLMNSVRCNIKCTPETLGKACFDGKIFAQILAAYNVCSYDYLKLINETHSKKVALSNLKKLCVWFKILGISITDEFLNEIVNQNGSASLRLLYELFIRLENKECMLYMDNKKMQRILSESTDKFKVTPVKDVEVAPDCADEKQYLRDLLNAMKGVMESAEKSSLKKFMTSGIKNRIEEMKQQIMADKLPPIDCQELEKLFPHLEVQAKINEFEDLVESPEGKENNKESYPCGAKEYISYLKVKRRKVEADKNMKEKLKKMSMQNAWRKILKNQEMELKNILSTKLLQQSEYEKQMTLRMKRMRLKYQKFIDTRNMVMSSAEKLETVNAFRSSFTKIKDQEKVDIEKQRIKELHERLFQEKIKSKKAMDREACRRILEDIVDLAMIEQDFFEQNGMRMPQNEIIALKLLFMKGTRLLPHDTIPKVSKIEEDAPIILDDERLEELAEYDFIIYMHRLGPWCINKRKEDDEQLNVTGYLVHRLLDLKYDFSLSAGQPADLPHYSYKIFIYHINDIFALEKLKYYLSKFNIEVFDIFQVVNYFLNCYRTHVGLDEMKESSKNIIPTRSRSNSFPVNKTEKIKFKPWSGVNEKAAKERLNADKAIQFPSNENLGKDKSPGAEIGQYIYEILQAGQLIPDSFLCYLIIEYLKSLSDIDGWVIINFPENIKQLAILEYMFTGLEVPYMPKITQNIRKLIERQLKAAMPKFQVPDKVQHPSLYEDQVEDQEMLSPEQYSIEELIQLKNSNILPRPNPPSEPWKFKSFFTKVIMLQREGERKWTKSKQSVKFSILFEENMEEKVTLESFYGSLDISSAFYYKSFDSPTLKKLLSLILNMSTSKQNELSKNIDKGFADATTNTIILENIKRFSEPPKFKKNALDDWVLKTFLEGEYAAMEEIGEEEAANDDLLIFPGHKDWEYCELNVPESYISVLATVWESIEYFYTRNLKKCFALLRMVERRLMPYRNYVRKKAEECLSVEDDRTEAVSNFQLMLNQINDHYRPLDTMKNELHNRVLKLQCDLWKMTDVKKFYCEQVLVLIMKQNWISVHLINMLQVYSLILQAEVDRFADTMQFIEDYYYATLLGKTNEERLMKIALPKIGLKSDKKDDYNRKASKHLPLSSSVSKRGRLFEEKHSKVHLDFDSSKTGLYYSDYESQEVPAISLLKALTSRLTKNVLQIKSFCESRANNVTDRIKDWSKMNVRVESKARLSREVPFIKKQLLKGVPMTSEAYVSFINKVSLEWAFAINYETKRVLYRINLIEEKASRDINEDISIIQSTFNEFRQDIINLYHNQILNTDKVCDLMRAAIEEEVKIQPLVVLKNDILEIDNSIIVYPNPPPPPPSPLEETATSFKFTISQLTNLFYKLVYVAPYGIIEQTFVLILEDMASIGHETGHSYLPPHWSDLSSDRIKDIVQRLYGDKVILDWRLFIIFGLDLGYPSLENILEMRNSFRVLDKQLTETVTYEQYSCVFLWFEGIETFSINEDLYIAKAKELLFKLFQVDENLMNYTDFLLALCRDDDPKEGFSKALALAEGCATVVWKQDLFRETLQIEKENEKYNVASGILIIVMAGVYQIVDSVTITDVTNEEVNPPVSNITSHEPMSPKKGGGNPPSTKKKRHHGNVANAANVGVQSEVKIDTAIDSQENSKTDDITIKDLDYAEKEKPQILWKSDVTFSTVFSLLMLDIHHFALSTDQIYEPLLLEERLRRIFAVKGKDQTIKLFHLLSDLYVQKLFLSYRCFQAFSIPQLLMKLAKDDCSSVVEQN